ncbi:hypothetical protein C0992_012644 [Termitomyces sp. T32_za158]|nr:hypothetical protein C0992_012644 [Termitomyces sp. T32_za158]
MKYRALLLPDQFATCRQPPDVPKEFTPKARANVAVLDAITEQVPSPPLFIQDNCNPTLPAIVEEENDIFISAYAPATLESLLPPFQAFISNADAALVADIYLKFNSILNSGCTTHLIKDKACFWTYDTSLAVLVGTANCGTLTTLVHGEICFRIHVDGKTVTIKLQDCLHVPDIPINLLSVGTMVEKDMKLLFEREATTIFFPPSVKELLGTSLRDQTYNKLFFLHCDFIIPHPNATAFPAIDSSILNFPWIPVTSAL